MNKYVSVISFLINPCNAHKPNENSRAKIAAKTRHFNSSILQFFLWFEGAAAAAAGEASASQPDMEPCMGCFCT